MPKPIENTKGFTKEDFNALLDEMQNESFDFKKLEPAFLDQLPLYALQYCETPELAVQWVQYFYEKGAQSMATDVSGRTAMHWAVIKGTEYTESYMGALKDILNQDPEGAELSEYLQMKDNKGFSPLDLALDAGNPGLFDFLMKNVGEPLPQGLLSRIIQHSKHTIEKKKELIGVFLVNGGSVNSIDEQGRSALLQAIALKDIDLARFVIEKGADINFKSQGQNKDTPLFLAVKQGDPVLVDLLLNHHVAINEKDVKGYTVLHHAILAGKYQLFNVLVKKGASLNLPANDGCTPLHLAAMSNNIEIITKVIPELCADKTHSLVREKPRFSAKDETGRTPLHWAVSSDNIRTVQQLARANTHSLLILDNRGFSPLHLAVERGDTNMVETLLRACPAGFDKNLKNGAGNTMLHLAVLKDDVQMVKFLREKGLDLNAQDAKGRTALHLFAEKGNFEMVEWLKKEGANTKIKDVNQKTARETAILAGNPSVAYLLSTWFQRTFRRKAMEQAAIKKTQGLAFEYERSNQIREQRMGQYEAALKTDKLDTSDTLLLMMAMWEQKITHATMLQIKNAYVVSDYKTAKNKILQELRGQSDLYAMASEGFSKAAKQDHAEKDASRRYFDTHFSVDVLVSRTKKDTASMRRFFKKLNIFSLSELKTMYDLWNKVSPEKRTELHRQGRDLVHGVRTLLDQENTPPEDRYSQAPGILKANMPLPMTELNPNVKKNRGVDKPRGLEPSSFAIRNPHIPVVGSTGSEQLYLMLGFVQAYLRKKFYKKGKPVNVSTSKKAQISEDLHAIVKNLSAHMVQKGIHSFGEITETLQSLPVQALFGHYGIKLNLDFSSTNRNKIFTDAAFYANTLASKMMLNESVQKAHAAKKKTTIQEPDDFLKGQQRGKVVLAEQPHTILKNSVYDLKWVGEICELTNSYELKDNIMLSPERLALLHITAYVETAIQRDPYAELQQPEDDLKKLISTQYYPKMMEYLRSNAAEILETKADIERRVQAVLNVEQPLRSIDPEMLALLTYTDTLRERLGSVGQYIEGVKGSDVLERAIRTRVYNQVMNAKMMEIAEKVGYTVTKNQHYPQLSKVFGDDRHTFFIVGDKGAEKGAAVGLAAVTAAQNMIEFADIIKPTLDHTGAVMGVGYAAADRSFTHFEASMVHDLIRQRHQRQLTEEDGHHALFEVETLTPALIEGGLREQGQVHAVIVSKGLEAIKSILEFEEEINMEFQVLQTDVRLGEYPQVVINANCAEKLAIINDEIANHFYGDNYSEVIQQLKDAGFTVTSQVAYNQEFVQNGLDLDVQAEDYQAEDYKVPPDSVSLKTQDRVALTKHALDIVLEDERLDTDAIQIDIADPSGIYNLEEAQRDPEGSLQKVLAYLEERSDNALENAPPAYNDNEIRTGLDIDGGDERRTPGRPGSAGK